MNDRDDLARRDATGSAAVTSPEPAAGPIRCKARPLVLALLAAMALSGCGKQIVDNLPPAPRIPEEGAGYGPVFGPYRIQPGDILDIKLLQVADLSEEVTVRPDGHFSTTVVEDERAFGRTVPELTAALKADYAAVMKEPHLTVIVKSFAPDRVYVGGEVTSPGEFISVPPNLTLSQAIARAGGVKPSGSYDNVIIIRRAPDNRPEVFQAHYTDAIKGADPAADVQLANFDLVYVPKTGVAEAYLFFNQYFQQFVPINWGFSYTLGANARNGALFP